MSLHLWELTERFKSLELLSSTDELPPEVLRDTLEAIEGEFELKAEAVAAFIQNLEAAAESKKEAAKAIADRAAMLSKRADSLRAYLLFHFQAMGLTRIERDRFTLILKSNPMSVVVDDESKLPASFMIQKPAPAPTPDKKALGVALKAGAEIAGCHAEVNQRIEIQL